MSHQEVAQRNRPGHVLDAHRGGTGVGPLGCTPENNCGCVVSPPAGLTTRVGAMAVTQPMLDEIAESYDNLAAEVQMLRASVGRVDRIHRLHVHDAACTGNPWPCRIAGRCEEDGQPWPCVTHTAAHPDKSGEAVTAP